jgi:hypothetical protein
MELTREGYAKLLAEYGLWNWPRRVGNPEVVIVANPSGFFRWFDRVKDGGRPVFIGHNAFVPPPFGKPLDQYQYVFTHALGDFDLHGGKTKELWEEVKRFAVWACGEGFAWGLIFTGSGFQFRIKFKQEQRSFAYLTKWEKAYWEGVRRLLDLKALDMPCADPARLERLPFTRYSHCKDPDVQNPDGPPVYTPTDRFCVPLPWQIVENGSYDTALAVAQEPEITGGYWHAGTIEQSLEEFVRLKGWQNLAAEFQDFHEQVAIEPKGPEADLMKMYIPHKLCLQTLIFNKDVGHTLFVAWISELASIGVPPSEILEHADRIANEAGWTNPKTSPYERRRQTDYVGRKTYSYNCFRLREKGLCVGSSCGLFAKSFPAEVGVTPKEKEYGIRRASLDL